MKVVFLDTVHPVLQTSLEQNGFSCSQHLSLSRDLILKGKISDVEGLVLRSRIQLDSELLQALPSLKWIARSGSGLENIDLHYAEENGIKVFNSPEGNRDAVGEHALGMLLMILHKLRSGDKSVHERVWDREKHRGVELAGKTVGILGYGFMGTAFAEKLSGMGCSVIAYDKYKKGYSSNIVKEVTEGEFFQLSDIVSVHVPWTEETVGLVNKTWLSRFAKPIIFLNTSRGVVTCTADLLDALDSDQISAGALDVLEFEGRSLEELENIHDTQKSRLLTRLLNHPNIILSPHVAGWTVESYEKLSSVLAEKILSEFQANND